MSCSQLRCPSLVLVGALVGLLQVLPSDAALNPSGAGDVSVRLKTVAEWTPNFSGSEQEVVGTELLPFNDGTGRLMVATLGGTIRVIDAKGELLSDKLLTHDQSGTQLPIEAGMTGLALHPDFANPGTFGYGKLYTITPEGAWNNGGVTNSFNDFPIPTGITEEHQDVIREWDLSSLVGNPNVNSLTGVTVADSREILRMDQQGPWHNMMDLAFNTNAAPGTDDYGQLYASVGDGWAGTDSVNAPEQPQMLDTVWGNILRINPDPTAHPLVRTSRNTGQPSYSVSPLNPYNGDDATETTNHFDDGPSSDTLAEIFANGMRSPYRMSFDSATGKLYVGDVGQGSREEVSVVGSGDNAGWGRWEGTNPYDRSVSLEGNTTHTEPLFEYTRSYGGTVVGGYVYRGSAIPDLYGKYVFLDYGNSTPTARLFYGTVDPEAEDYGEFYEMQIDPAGDQYVGPTGDRPMPDHVFSVGVDADGELYLVAGEDPRGAPVFPATYVIQLTAAVLEGDYNADGVVDAADYTAWRDNLGNASEYAIRYNGDGGGVDAGDYTLWASRYGDAAAGGSKTVPEPTGVAIAALAAAALCQGRRLRLALQ